MHPILLLLFIFLHSLCFASSASCHEAPVNYCDFFLNSKKTVTIRQANEKNLPVLVIVDAVSSGNLIAPFAEKEGFYVLNVVSTGTILPNFIRSFSGKGIHASIAYKNNLKNLVKQILSFGKVVAVLPGAESAVEFTPLLQSELQKYFPDILNIGSHPEFRDKLLLGEMLEKAGLPFARQKRVTSIDEALKWFKEQHFEKDHWRTSKDPIVVLKPPKSSGTEGVFSCRTENDIRSAFEKIFGITNQYSIKNDSILMMEFLPGKEYVVDLVRGSSLDLQTTVTKITDLWVYNKKIKKGGSNLYDFDELLDPYGTLQDNLIHVVTKATDFMKYNTGFIHAEVIDSPRGLIIIDMAARMMGAGQPRIVEQATEHSQIDYGIAAFTDLKKFNELPDRYTVKRHANLISLTSKHKKGRLSLEKVEALKKLKSLQTYHFYAKAGQFVSETQNLTDIIGQVELVHPNSSILEKERNWVRHQKWVIPVK